MRKKSSELTFLCGITIGITLFLMFLGPWVRAADAGLACPDWPKCYGLWLPFEHASYKVFLEWFHRLLALTASLFFLYLFIRVLLHSQRKHEKILIVLAAILLAIQIILGGLTVLWQLQPTIVNLHLLTALLFLSCLFIVWLGLKRGDSSPRFLSKRKGFSFLFSGRLQIWSILFFLIFVQIITGGRMSTHGAGLACDAFPPCYYQSLPGGEREAIYVPDLSVSAYEIHFTHRWGGIALFLVILLFWLAIRRGQKFRNCLKPQNLLIQEEKLQSPSFLLAMRTLSILITLFALQILLGAINVWWKIPTPITVIHSAVAIAIHLAALATWLHLHEAEYESHPTS